LPEAEVNLHIVSVSTTSETGPDTVKPRAALTSDAGARSQLNAEAAGAADVLVVFDEEGLEVVVVLEELLELEQAASANGRRAATAMPARPKRAKRVLFMPEE
jgi:hypothetical protein